MVQHAIYLCLGTLFILTSMHVQSMDINVTKEDYTQIADAENGDQIDLKKKIDTPAKKAANRICSVLPSLNKGRLYWLAFGTVYTITLGLTIYFTYANTNNNPFDCPYPLPEWCTPQDWCTQNVQTVSCCPQGPWENNPPVYQCLSNFPQICLNSMR